MKFNIKCIFDFIYVTLFNIVKIISRHKPIFIFNTKEILFNYYYLILKVNN